MLPSAVNQVRRHSRVKRAVALAGHDVNSGLFHVSPLGCFVAARLAMTVEVLESSWPGLKPSRILQRLCDLEQGDLVERLSDQVQAQGQTLG